MSDINIECVSDCTKKLIADYEARAEEFQLIFKEFQERHQQELMNIDNVREELNVVLEDAKKSLREDAKLADYRKIQRIKVGLFSVAKKWSSWYIVEGFVEIIKELGLFDAAVDEGIINIETKVNGKLAVEFARKNGIEDELRPVQDGKELTPAVTCPKPVAAFGAALQ